MKITDLIINKIIDYIEPGLKERAVSFKDLSIGSGGEHSNALFSPSEYGEYLARSSAVYTAITYRSDLLNEMPLKLFKKENDQKVEVDSGPLFDLLHFVNPFWTLYRLLSMTSMSLDLWGANFWFLDRGVSGKGPVKEIWWVRPDYVRVKRSNDKYIVGYVYEPPGGEKQEFSIDETIWIPNPNPIDQFNGLSPLGPARISADLNLSALHSNKNIFDQGMMLGGLLVPVDDIDISREQAVELEEDIAARFTGERRAHKIGVMRYRAKFETAGMTPEDMEFISMLEWTVEDIARVYRIPIDLISGKRTYENVEASMKAVWTNAIKPLGRFLSTELTKKLLPMFGTQADFVEFDHTVVEVLQEDQKEITEIMNLLNKMGVPINPLLKLYRPELLPEGGNGYEWGDTWWVQSGTVPSGESVALGAGQIADDSDRSVGDGVHSRVGIDMESEEHKRAFKFHMRRLTKNQKVISDMQKELFTRQRDSVEARLKNTSRDIEDAEKNPFDMKQWVKIFREEMRDSLDIVVDDVGQGQLDELDLDIAFHVDAPEVVKAMEIQSQSFALEVNKETWKSLRKSLADGIDAGEGIDELSDRLTGLFDYWIEGDPAVAGKESRVDTIARTETVKATTTGSLESVDQTGLETEKSWLSALQAGRTRDTHAEAHFRYQDDPIPLDEDFIVGGASGPGPGQLGGSAEEEINCLCSITFKVKE